MTFDALKKYLQEQMKMSHVYQPVMLKRLLIGSGTAKVEEIALDLVQNDLSQIEYYTDRVHNMVGRVLRKNGLVDRDKSIYLLKDFQTLNNHEIQELIDICDEKIKDYIQKRDLTIWDHRRRNRKPIDGSIRYQVLNRAHNRCELCGISSDIKALEVDHIVPKNWNGADDIHNYQALCYSCNANKRDTDDTDFRDRGKVFEGRESYCVFCHPDREKIAENNLAYAIKDAFPVSIGHTLIIPKRHFDSYFDITQPELNAVQSIIKELQPKLIQSDPAITGFNIGINQGADAGQTIFHCHIHFIPRRNGDIENPRGGIRNLMGLTGIY